MNDNRTMELARDLELGNCQAKCGEDDEVGVSSDDSQWDSENSARKLEQRAG